MLAPGFGEEQSSTWEVKRRETALARKLRRAVLPVQSARDHQVKNHPEIVVKTEHDPLAQSANLANRLPFHRRKRWVISADEKWAADADGLELLADDSTLDRFDVEGDVR